MPITQQPLVHHPVSLLEVGDSYFVPALYAGQYIHRIKQTADMLGFTIDYRMGMDTATRLYGMRVIRTA